MILIGFNITEFMGMDDMGAVRIDDFCLIKRLGFNYVRFPLNYRLWISRDGKGIDLFIVKRLDVAINAALDAGLHVCLAMHRAPGYTVSRDGPEPTNLWKDPQTQAAFAWQWKFLAERYATIDQEAISFNLINEPGVQSERMSREDHDHVIRLGIAAVREVRADRRIVIDGLAFGREPHPSLIEDRVWQSCRGYDPFVLTHYGSGRTHKHLPEHPAWPLEVKGKGFLDIDWLRSRYRPWGEVIRNGAIVHCGEFGCSTKVPHDVMLNWTRDLLRVFSEMGIGFALWNFRGPFGIIDTGRQETIYEPSFSGNVDKKLLGLLQEYEVTHEETVP